MYQLKSILRFTAYAVLRPFVIEKAYSDSARTTSGYRSSLSLPVIGCIGFVHASGQKQFFW